MAVVSSVNESRIAVHGCSAGAVLNVATRITVARRHCRFRTVAAGGGSKMSPRWD